MEQPRRTSKLGSDSPFDPPPPKPADKETHADTEGEGQAEPSSNKPAAPREATSAPISRNTRRLTVHQNVSDEDMVSFNCKMSRGLRRSVRHYAADVEVDIQDVVAAALVDYLQARDRPVPDSELRQPDGRMDV